MSDEAIKVVDTNEVPKAFVKDFESIKEKANEQAQVASSEEKPKRGRPRKVKDELDTTVKDEADAVKNSDTALEDQASAEQVDEKTEVNEEIDEKDEEKPPQGEEQYIPDSWVNAGRKAGLSDTTIQDLAEKSPDALKRLAGEVEPPVIKKEPRSEMPAQTAASSALDELLKPVEIKLDRELHGDEIADAFEALVKRDNEKSSLMKRIIAQNEAVGKEMQTRNVRVQEDRFDSMLDKVASEIPAVGNSEKLTDKSNEYATRKLIWDKAAAIRRGDSKATFEESVDDALHWFRSKHGTRTIEQQTVTKLKARVGRLTYKPTHKSPVQVSVEGDGEKGFERRFKQIQQKYEP